MARSLRWAPSTKPPHGNTAPCSCRETARAATNPSAERLLLRSCHLFQKLIIHGLGSRVRGREEDKQTIYIVFPTRICIFEEPFDCNTVSTSLRTPQGEARAAACPGGCSHRWPHAVGGTPWGPPVPKQPPSQRCHLLKLCSRLLCRVPSCSRLLVPGCCTEAEARGSGFG